MRVAHAIDGSNWCSNKHICKDRRCACKRLSFAAMEESRESSMTHSKAFAWLAAVSLLIACGFGTSVNAQTACPVGTPAGAATCGPSPASGGEMPPSPPRPSGEWLKTWGAIATTPHGDAGVSSIQASEDDAKRVAMKNCAALGNTNCTVTFTYRNQCVAAVNPIRGGEGSVISSAETLDKALTRAMGKCEQASGGKCKASIAECSPPVFRRF